MPFVTLGRIFFVRGETTKVGNIFTLIYYKMVIRKETKNLGNLLIKAVDKRLAKELIIKNHYSQKWLDSGFGRFNYGIFKEEQPDECLGVAVYGLMKNSKARIFTHPRPFAWNVK